MTRLHRFGAGRRALTLAVALFVLLQGFAVQTHVHLKALPKVGVVTAVAGHSSSQDQDDVPGCVLCQAVALLGAWALPGDVMLPFPVELATDCYSLWSAQIASAFVPRSGHSRAPPSLFA